MVLEQHNNVRWFMPTRPKAPVLPSICNPSPDDKYSHFRIPCSPSPAQTVTPKVQVTESRGVEVSAGNNCTIVDPWSVYGPAFDTRAASSGRNSRLGKNVLRASQTNSQWESHVSSTLPPGQRHNRRQVYPNDTLPPVSGKVRNIDYDHFFSSRFYAENGYSEDASDSDFDICKGEDPLPLDEDAATSGILLPKEQDIYFGDMPLELLNHIFLDFMRISNESLQSLAQERNEARIKASQMTSPSSASASATVTLTDLSSAGNAIDSARAEIRSSRNTTFWHAHRGHQRRRHRHPYHQHQHDVEYGLFQDLHIATQSTSLSSSSASLSSHLATDSQLSDAASNLVLVTDQDLSYDGEQEEDEDEEGNSNNDADSDISDEFQEEALDSTEAAAGFNDDGSEYSTASVDRGISQLGESSDSGSHDIDFAYRDDTATQSATSSSPPTSPASPSSYSEDEDYDDDDNEDEEDERSYESDHDIDTENSRPSSFRAAVATTGSGNVVKSRRLISYHRRRRASRLCCCQRSLMATAALPRPRLGINRVDSDLDEDKMLYQLHRDQHFHPTTHTSLRSDLYICSLVNRQWRMAALQLLWQSVVLDSESCRPEPSDPCVCCRHPRACRQHSHRRSGTSVPSASDSFAGTLASESSTSSSSSPRACIARTRLEAMLDAYQDVYGLDLAKCVQTIELDLRLLVWSAEGESVKRILRRLSPFSHLRLVWAGKESPEEMMVGFRVAMESMHSQIHHLHFFSGFVISQAWAREMEKMTRLETVTIESLGSLDVIEYDWARLKCLRLNAVIPRSVFGMPTTPATLMTTAASYHPESVLPVVHHTFTNHHHPGGALATGQAGHGLLTVAQTGLNIVNLVPWTTHNTGSNDWSTSHYLLSPPLSGTATAFSSHSSATATQSSAHPERLRNITSGWWQWTGLRKLEIQLKNTVLPREWLQDLTAAIAQNSLTLTKKEQYFQQQQRLGSKLAIIPRPHDLSTRELGSEFVTSYGPPLEVINIDCEVSHPHKDIFMDFIRVWGHHMEEFHFSQSGELTDEFFWLCLQRMTRLKKLSLRDSKGITGEGINTRLPTTAAGRGCQEDKMTRDNLGNLEGVVDSLAVQSALSSIDVPADGGANTTTLDAAIQENLAPYPSKASTRKAAKVPILWRRDFKELHLDQSRIRQEFLQTLRRQCPGVMYKVREVRHRAI